MRRRFNTIHAENVDDFMTAIVRQDYQQNQPRRPPSKRPSKVNRHDHASDEHIYGTDKPFVKANQDLIEESDPCWDGFDVDCENIAPDQDRRAMTMPSLTLSDNTVDTDCSEDVEGNMCKIAKTSNSVLKRIMVIGMPGSGKHSLINTMFECGEKVSDRKTQMMDLLMKTEEDEEDCSQVRYQFWIQNLQGDINSRQKKLENLIKVYYRNVSLFVFMYSLSDKKSFECLEDAIQSVLKEVPPEKFRGVLLGNKGDLEQKREVSQAEGVSLQDKYKLTCFMESGCGDKSLKDRLVHLLHEGEGREIGSKKGHSILSTD